MKTGTLVSSLRISSLLVASLALLPVDKRKREQNEAEGFPALPATDVVDSERTAQTVDPTQFAKFRADMLVAVNKSAFGGANLWHNKYRRCLRSRQTASWIRRRRDTRRAWRENFLATGP